MRLLQIQYALLVIALGSLDAEMVYPEVDKTGQFEHSKYCDRYLEITTKKCPDGQLFDTTTNTCVGKDNVKCDSRQVTDCYPYGVDGCTTYPGPNDRKCCPQIKNGVEKATKCVSLGKSGGGYRTTCNPA